jgi:serine/threonine protein phosphatase 1
MRTFVMGDIHGAHKALKQCLERAAFDRGKDVLIQLGDVADGSESYLRLIGKENKILYTGVGYKTALNPADIPESHRQFFHNQHWNRELWSAALSYNAFESHLPGKSKFRTVTRFNEIFIGHTSTVNWKTDQPMKAANIYNLDTGAGYSGRLTIMDVESKQFWQSDPVGQLNSTTKI